MKKRHEQVIKYAETFEKLSEDENVALVHIENLCMRGVDLEESLKVAETLKVLEEIAAEDALPIGSAAVSSNSLTVQNQPVKTSQSTDRKIALR